MPNNYPQSLARQLRSGLPTEIKNQPDMSVYQILKVFDVIYKFEREFVHGLYDKEKSRCICDKHSKLLVDQYAVIESLDKPSTNYARVTRVAILSNAYDSITHWGSGGEIQSQYAENPRKNAGYTDKQRDSLKFAGHFLISPKMMKKYKDEGKLTASYLSELYQVPIFVSQGLIADFSFKLFKERLSEKGSNKYL